MDRWLLGLVAGVLGGAGGALALRLTLPEARGAASLESPEAGGAARLERLERLLAALEARGPALEGRHPDPAAGAAQDAARLLATEGGQALRKALREEVVAALDTRIEALEKAGKAAAAPAAAPEGAKKRRVALAEAARELALSSDEEAALRKIYADAEEKMLKVVAGPEGDVEAVRKDLEDAKRDPKRRGIVMMKYMPKMLPRIADVMQVELEKQAAVEETLGADKAARLESEFNVIEGDPLGGGDDELRVEARRSNR